MNLRRPHGSIKTPHSIWKRYLGAVDQTLEGLQAAAADRAAWIKATEVVTKPLYKTSSKFIKTAIAQSTMKPSQKKTSEKLQHQDFARGLPPYYYPGQKVLNFADRTGCGALTFVWP